MELEHPSETSMRLMERGMDLKLTRRYEACENCALRTFIDISFPYVMSMGDKSHWFFVVENSTNHALHF